MGLYAVLARDVEDFIDMIREPETTNETLAVLHEMIARPQEGQSKDDAELNGIGARIVAREIQPALDAAIRSLNAANDAVNYAGDVMRKAKEAQAEAQKAVKILENIVQDAWQAEQTSAKG